MTFLNDKRIRHLENNLPDFTRKVDPIELLPYLPCLTQSSKEEIESRQRQYNKSQAAMKMYEHLIRMDNWWEDLLVALRSNHQNQLADKLEEIDENVRPPGVPTARKLPPARPRVYSGDTKYEDLPASVSVALRILDSQDVDCNWEALAAYFRYTNEDVTRIKCNQNQASCTKKLLEDWSQREDATLQNLLIALQELERFDLLEKVQNVTDYRLPKARKGPMDCDGHGCDVLLPTEMMFGQKNRDMSVAPPENTCMLPPHSKHDSAVFSGRVDSLNRDSQTQVDKRLSASDKAVGLRRNVSDVSPDPPKEQSEYSMSLVENDTKGADNPRKDEDEDDRDHKCTPDTRHVCGNNNNMPKDNTSFGFNDNTKSYPKTMKDKVIEQLPPLLGISVLGICAVMASMKSK